MYIGVCYRDECKEHSAMLLIIAVSFFPQGVILTHRTWVSAWCFWWFLVDNPNTAVKHPTWSQQTQKTLVMVKLLNLSSDSWRSHSATDGLKNGDASSSSLAAKGFRSVRPNLQDKKSPSQVKHHSQYTDRHSRIYFCCCYLKFNYKCNFMMWCASVGFWVSEWGKKLFLMSLGIWIIYIYCCCILKQVF